MKKGEQTNSAMVANKATLRLELRRRLSGIPSEERAANSVEICSRLSDLPCWHSAQSVLLYMPMGDEPDLRSLFQRAWAQQKIVALPRHSPDSDEYLAAGVSDSPRDLVRGRFGLLEPGAHCSPFPLNRLDLVLVPGIGFDLCGGRLGRGKGYYDRLLAGVPGTKCGVAFDWQLVDEVPCEPHDVRLNCLLTPTRWLKFSNALQS